MEVLMQCPDSVGLRNLPMILRKKLYIPSLSCLQDSSWD